MPEGPEVKLTTEYLSSVLENQIITRWVFLPGQYIKTPPAGFEDFEVHLPMIIEDVKCKGKMIYFSCFNEFNQFFILHSMRMTGSWVDEEDEYCRWYIELDNGKKIWFRDPRCLATLHFTRNEDTLQGTLKKLGPDIFTEEFSLENWRRLLCDHKNKNITAFLMDQNIISGIGNYIKAEVLYSAKISPLRKVSSLTDAEAEKLYEAIRIIPRLSYMNKGLSIRDYRDNHGHRGYQEFHLKIYNKPHAKKIKTADGRTTHYDPDIQV